MATLDVTARNSILSDFASDYSSATLQIRSGTNVLATHTLAGFGAPSNGSMTANAIADATITGAGSQTADNARLTSLAGTIDLTVGTTGSGQDLELSTLTYVNGETSSISSLTVTKSA